MFYGNFWYFFRRTDTTVLSNSRPQEKVQPTPAEEFHRAPSHNSKIVSVYRRNGPTKLHKIRNFHPAVSAWGYSYAASGPGPFPSQMAPNRQK